MRASDQRRLIGLAICLVALYYHPELMFFVPVIGLVNLDPINTATTKNIMPGLADNFEGAARR
jgi:hypothetical protein